MATLKLAHLVKKYGATVIIDDLDLEVRDGEFLTLLGPSGCGKTTTLRAIAGLIEIDSGDIYFGNRRMNDVPPHKRSTAMVFQSYALFPHMTVRKNIAFGLALRQVPPKEQQMRVDEVMALVGLSGLGERKPRELSGGQQQRVALARAVVTQPDILLFDEPLSNLDAKLRERLRIEIRELQRRLKITSIYVTHDQAEALVMSDRIAVMNQGRIEQLGDPYSIYRHPLSRFSAEFIGQANIVAAQVVQVGAAEALFETPIGRLIVNQRVNHGSTEVMLAWRPEDMLPGDSTARNRLSGQVTRSIFMGNLTDLQVVVNGVTLRVQTPGLARWEP